MTIFHDDELNNSELAMVRRRKKRIPLWAQSKPLRFRFYFNNQIYGCRRSTAIGNYKPSLFSR